MSETSLDAWGAKKGNDVDDSHVTETDLTSLQHADDGQGGHSGFGGDHEHHRGDEFAGADIDAEAQAEADAHAAKKKKDLRTLMIAGGAVGVLVLGLVAVKVTRGGGEQYAQIEQAPATQAQPQLAQQTPDQGQVIAQVGPQAQQAAAVIDASGSQAAPAPASGVAGLDFGLQSSSQASAPAAHPALMPSAAVVAQPAPIQGGLAPAVQQSATGKAQVGPSAAEMEALRTEMNGLRNALEDRSREVAKLREDLSSLKQRVTAAPAAPKQVAVAKADAPKPAKVEVARQESVKAVITEKAVVETPVAAKATPAAVAGAKGKARSDYRMYAYADERFWIKGDDGEPFLVGMNSPLPDGTRVTALNKDAGTVSTTAGEIK